MWKQSLVLSKMCIVWHNALNSVLMWSPAPFLTIIWYLQILCDKMAHLCNFTIFSSSEWSCFIVLFNNRKYRKHRNVLTWIVRFRCTVIEAVCLCSTWPYGLFLHDLYLIEHHLFQLLVEKSTWMLRLCLYTGMKP